MKETKKCINNLIKILNRFHAWSGNPSAVVYNVKLSKFMQNISRKNRYSVFFKEINA